MEFRRWHIRREISFHQILFFLHRARLSPITPVLSHYPAQAPTSDRKYKYFQSLQCQNVKRMHCSDDSKNIYCTHYGALKDMSLRLILLNNLSYIFEEPPKQVSAL